MTSAHESLAHTASLGGMCTIRLEHDAQDQPLDVMCADTDALGARLATVAMALGTNEPRVAASSVQYELAERLWAVLIATWSHHQLVVNPSGLHVGPTTTSWSLAISKPDARRLDRQPAPEIARVVLPRLKALHRTIRTHTSIAEGLLWGNAATAATLAPHGINDLAARSRAHAVVTHLLTLGPLKDRLDGPVDGTITRRSCCLYYRTRDARACGDCPLRSSTVLGRAARSRKSP